MEIQRKQGQVFIAHFHPKSTLTSSQKKCKIGKQFIARPDDRNSKENLKIHLLSQFWMQEIKGKKKNTSVRETAWKAQNQSWLVEERGDDADLSSNAMLPSPKSRLRCRKIDYRTKEGEWQWRRRETQVWVLDLEVDERSVKYSKPRIEKDKIVRVLVTILYLECRNLKISQVNWWAG